MTGEPGVGKTTTLLKVVNMIKSQGFIVGGVVSRELRSGGARVGFELIDINSGQRGVLASISQDVGPRFGRYRINLKDLAEVGANALKWAIENSDIIVCDEIGPMELFSPEFRRAVIEVLKCGKPVIGIIHKRMRDPLLNELRSAPYCELIEVTYENRDKLPDIIADKVLARLKSEVK
ncbi:MAG: NTPase [Nitrososphaerales archaeon]|nr:NTPase [Nitrososphaerales archaeon]